MTGTCAGSASCDQLRLDVVHEEGDAAVRVDRLWRLAEKLQEGEWRIQRLLLPGETREVLDVGTARPEAVRRPASRIDRESNA